MRRNQVSKYIRKPIDGQPDEDPIVYEATLLEEDTTIATEYGPILVTAGNYVLQDPDGKTFGVAAADLEALYEEQ